MGSIDGLKHEPRLSQSQMADRFASSDHIPILLIASGWRSRYGRVKNGTGRWSSFHHLVYVVFSEGRTAFINYTGAILLGAKDPQEILDRPTFEFIHPDYHQEVRNNVTRLLIGGVSVHSAERIYLKMDGTPIPVQVEAARITWNGKPAILGLFSDITERKQAEQALWKSRQAIRALHDISSAQGHSFKERVDALLQLGCRFFDLPIGMETFVRGDELEVGQVNAPGLKFHPGMRVSLSKTYSSEALRRNGTVCFAHAGASPEWQQHPEPTPS